MSKHRLIAPLKKGLDSGFNLFFFHGNANHDCFYYNFLKGTLTSNETFKNEFLKNKEYDVDNYIYINENKLNCFMLDGEKILDNTENFFKQKQEEDLLDGISKRSEDEENKEITDELERQAENSNTKFKNNLNLLCEKIKKSSKKVLIYLDNFEWTAGLYLSNKDECLEFIKTIKKLALEKNSIILINISDLELLEQYHFNVEDNTSIYIGNPSSSEVKDAFFRKFMHENNNDNIQENLLDEIEYISQAISSSKKDLRSALRVYTNVLKKSEDKIIDRKDFEIAIEKILEEKILLKDVILEQEKKDYILKAIDSFLESDDNKNFRKGIILEGPSGTGKTFIAKAIANERNCFFMSPTLTDFKGEFVGQTSAKVKRIFEQARANQPAILFIDEADTVFADRNAGAGMSDSFNLDMVNQFLVEIDGLTTGNQKIFVIAATNRVGVIDQAIKSRLSERINIGLPKKDERIKLFDKKFEKHNFKFNGRSFTQEIAEKTEKMSGRDIDNFVKKIIEDVKVSSYKKISNLKDDEVVKERFFKVLKSSELELISDMCEKIPLEIKLPKSSSVKYDDIIGYDKIKQQLDRQILACMNEKEQKKAEKLGVITPKGVLLYGPPGNSKTKLAEACANENGLYFVKVLSKDFIASTYEKQLKNIQMIFDKVIQLSKMCTNPKGVLLFFDEVDALASIQQLNSTVRGTLLDYLSNDKDGVRAKDSKVMVMMATNYQETLDPAVVRKGRIDQSFFMDNPTEEHGTKIFEKIVENDKNTKFEPMLVRESYENLCKKRRLEEKSKIIRTLSLVKGDERQLVEEQIDEMLKEIRPSGADIIECFNSLKAEAYHMNNSTDIIKIDKNILNAFFEI